MAHWNYVSEDLVHLLDPEFLGYPKEYRNPTNGDRFPVAPFQYIESHDHERFSNDVATVGVRDLLGEPHGDRPRFFVMKQ
jgi:hypothetical protein